MGLRADMIKFAKDNGMSVSVALNQLKLITPNIHDYCETLFKPLLEHRLRCNREDLVARFADLNIDITFDYDTRFENAVQAVTVIHDMLSTPSGTTSRVDALNSSIVESQALVLFQSNDSRKKAKMACASGLVNTVPENERVTGISLV